MVTTYETYRHMQKYSKLVLPFCIHARYYSSKP